MKYLILIIVALAFQISVVAQNSSHNVAITRAKALFVATANGDVAKLKQLMTPEFYKENYPYSDSRVRDLLLSVPVEKRERMIDQIQNKSLTSTIMNRAGDVITVTFTNKITKKEITVQLLDENENGDWKVFNYWY